MVVDGNVSGLWRLIHIIGMLQLPRGYRAAELAETLEVSRRTVYRDLKTLSLAGVPLYSDDGVYRVHSRFFLKPIQFEFTELMVLAMATRALSSKADGPYGAASARALAKITAALPEDIWRQLESARASIAYDPQPLVDLSGHGSTVELLQRAVLQSRQVEVEYYSISSDSVCSRQLDPHSLFFRWRAWYLAAYCHLRGEIRLFRVDRIRSIRLLSEAFERQSEFELEDFMGSALRVELGPVQDVAIWFAGELKRWICEVEWHPSQVIQELPDGAVVLRLRTGSMGEVKRWVLGFGQGARVLEPAQLAAELAAETRAMAEAYGDG